MGPLKCLRLTPAEHDAYIDPVRCARQELHRAGTELNEALVVEKIKESYRKKGLKEKQVTNLEALQKEIAQKKQEYLSGANKYPDAASRKSKEYIQALWEA